MNKSFYELYIKNKLVDENIFIGRSPKYERLPSYKESRDRLPAPIWDGHEVVIECYWKAWQIAFKNLKCPNKKNGFVSNYIDTAFNDCLFMWDSVFILMFAKYGRNAFEFQQTLDNLYAKQHPDGFICREIDENSGNDKFHRFDPSSTGPNVLPWSEWEYYCLTGDKQRLAEVFPVLAAYHRWLRAYRTWPDGTYWSSGWGCGMDNQPRLLIDRFYYHEAFYHGHMVWLDACLQQILSAKNLVQMSEVLGRVSETQDFLQEARFLKDFINNTLWDETTAFYYDLHPGGVLSDVKSIGAYWALLTDIVPDNKLNRFIAHLENPSEFKRPHRIPSLSADHPDYKSDGDYWKGAVWAPTNYMVLKGLSNKGYDSLAHEIAMNHIHQVVNVYNKTNTLWENYSPEYIAQGIPSKPDFVGWSGLPPIAVLFEYIFGLKPDVARNELIWNINLTEEHGVKRYPFGIDGTVDLKCNKRSSIDEKPDIEVKADVQLTLKVKWNKGYDIINVN